MAILEASQVAALAADPAPAATLIASLRRAGYRTLDLLDALDADSPVDVLGRTAFYALLAGADLASSRDRMERLFALFTLGAALDADAYETSLPDDVRGAVAEAGLVARDASGAARATVTIAEHEGVFVIADRLFELQEDGVDLIGDAVAMPPHFSTFRMLAAASQLPVGRTLLDVGTGAGSIPLLGPGGYTTVTGIDLQPRAVAMARLNARLNGHADYTFVVGDARTFNDGRQYDHVLFNSPGEFALVDRFAARVPELVTPGGVCLVLAWLCLRTGESAMDCLTGWADRWHDVRLTAQLYPASPFSATATEVAAARPRVGSYLNPEYLAGLRADGVVQRVEAVLTLEPGGPAPVSVFGERCPSVPLTLAAAGEYGQYRCG